MNAESDAPFQRLNSLNCVIDPLHVEYLGCDALYPNVLDCGTGWNRSVQTNPFPES